jgi:hypothetical protein
MVSNQPSILSFSVTSENEIALIRIPKHYLVDQDEDSITVDIPESVLLNWEKDYKNISQAKGILFQGIAGLKIENPLDLTTARKSNHDHHQGQRIDKRTPDFHAYPTDQHNPTSNQFWQVTSERCLRRATPTLLG